MFAYALMGLGALILLSRNQGVSVSDNSSGNKSPSDDKTPVPPPPPPSTNEPQSHENVVDDLLKKGGLVGIGIAAGTAFSQGFNKLVLGAAKGKDPNFDKELNVLEAVSTIGFTVAGGLLAISVAAGIVVYTVTFFAICVALLVYVLINPHPIPFKDARRDKAITAYDQLRGVTFQEARDSMAMKYPDFDQGEIEVYAACFADGFIRTLDAISVESMRKSGLSAGDIENQRLQSGTSIGFEFFWDISQLDPAHRKAVIADKTNNLLKNTYLGGTVLTVDPDTYGRIAGLNSSLVRYNEPAFPTLIQGLRTKWPNILRPDKVLIQQRIGMAYRRADQKAGYAYTYVPEYFLDTPKGRSFYDGGGYFAWGSSYVSAMLAGIASGKSPSQALKDGKASGLIHSAATETVLSFTLDDGKKLSFAWQDYANETVLPPPEDE